MPTHPGRAIITYGRSLQSLAAARSLAERGVEVIGCDEAPLMALSFSRHVMETFTHPSPRDDAAGFIDRLSERIERHRPSDDRPYVVMPIHTESRVIARHRDRLPDGVRVTSARWSQVDRVWPKDHLVETAREADVPQPPTVVVDSVADAAEAAAGLNYPLFVKVGTTVGAHGVDRVDGPEELEAACRKVLAWAKRADGGRLLIQQAADGDDYCFTGLWRHGEPIAHMTYRNLQMLPPSGGTGVLRETVDGARLAGPSNRLMERVGWHGVAQVDYRWTGEADDAPQLIEVNPRFWAGLFQSIASGVDFPWLLFQMVCGRPLDRAYEARIGTRTRTPLAGLYGAIRHSIDEDRLDEIADAWRRAVSGEEGGSRWASLKTFGRALMDVIDPATRVERLTEAIAPHLDADVEAMASDDPLVPLGVLYVVGSLLRRGQLPEELK